MKDIVRKTAALILALAMIVTFTPIYGMGAIAYAEDEEVAADQNTAEGKDLAAGEELSGDEAGEEDQVSPDEENPVVEEPVVEDEGDPEEDVVEEAAGEEEPPLVEEGKMKALGNGDGEKGGDGDDGKGDDDPFADIYQTGLEGPNIIFNDGLAKYKLTDQEALNVEGVTHYEAFVGVPREGPWDAVDPACYSYDDSTKTVTVDGRVLEQKHPDYMIDKRLAVQILGLDDEDNFKMIATKMPVDFWPTYSRYDLPEDREVLPGWDGSIDGRVHYYIENSEYPDGYDTNLNVEDVEVIEGRDLLEDWHYDEDDNNHWWYYRAGRNLGNVTFRMTYRDVDGSTKTHDVHVTIGGDVYRVDLYVDGNIDKLLPGQEVTLHAWPGHEFWTGEHGGYTSEGMNIEWSLIRNDNDAGELIVDENDPGTARLRIREPEDGEEILAGIRVKVAVYDENDPDVEKASQERFFEASQDFYDIHPTDLNFNMPLGSFDTQHFELHHYTFRDGRPNDDILPATKARFDYNEEGFRITKEGYAEQLRSGEEVTDCDTFTIQRTREFGGDINLTLWGEDNIQCHKRYWFADMNYDLWFDRDNIDIYSDIPDEDFPEATTLRLNTGNFGNGAEADENFDFTIEAAIDRGRDRDEVIPADKISTERDGDELVITIDKDALMQGLNGHRDIRVVANAASKDGSWQLDHPEEAWIHIEEARREIFEPERERDMLPGEGDNLDWIRLEIRNTEYPDGQEFQFPVTNVVVTEGEEYLETVPTDDNDWHFDIKACGDIIFDLTFENEKGEVENYQVTRHATGDIYDVWQHRDGPSDNGLPGTSIELWADGVHRYITENGEHRETWEGLDFGWRFAYGEEFATLTVDENDHSHATLTFKELPDGEDWIDEEVRVEVGVMDPESDDPQEWRAMEDRNYWVRSEYHELWPTELGLLNLGQSTDDITFTVRHYSLSENGEAGYNEYSVDKMEWRFNRDDISISFEEGEIYDGEEIEDDTFSFFRKTRWDTNADYTVWFRDEYGGDCEMNGGFHFDTLNYNQWFDTHDAPVYDDWNWTFNLQRQEELDYSGLETNIKAGHYEWHEEEDEDIWVEAPDDCWSLSEDGMSVTVYGDKMAENDIHDMWIYAEAMYNGDYVGESGECHVWLEESCTSRGEEHLWLSAPPEYADCYSPGWQKQMCWNCGERRTIEVPARGHIATAVKAKAATASKEGNVAYWKCSFCGKCFSDKACTKEVTADSRIIPKGTTISKVAAASKGFTVTWKKPTGNYLKHTTGYEVQYALDSKFKKSANTVDIKKNGTVTKKVTKLKAKTKYFVRVRTYRTIDKKKVYGPWSKVKYITTK